MNDMKISLIFMGIILAFGSVLGTSLQRFIIEKVTIHVEPNPYVKSVDVQINGKHNDTVTIKMPIEEEIPDDVILINHIIYNGEEIPPMKGKLCEVLNDKIYAPDVLKAGIPKDKFPKQCPILPNNDYTILNYYFSPEKLPPGLPDGKVVSNIYVSRDIDDNDYFLRIHAESRLHTDTPGALMG